MENLTGRQFGPYQIVAPLGEGGMAAVYKAYQPAMERYVALKVLPRNFAEDPLFIARFQREAILLAKLQHPHILPVFDYGQTDGFTYIVMPFVRTGTLTALLSGAPVPLLRIRQVISQVGDALSYAHSRGMIHRDIKPSNILVDESGNCLLTDFGLARMLEDSVNLTSSGTIMGTPAYMAPEQGSGQKVDARSDIYSLGVVLYEMATGRVPYKAETPIAVVFKHINDPLPPARSLNPNLPEAVELVIMKALAKNPDNRYQSAGDMMRAIQTAIPDTVEKFNDSIPPTLRMTPTLANQKVTESFSPVVKKEKPARSFTWVVLAGFVILLLIAGVFVKFNNSLTPAVQATETEKAVPTAAPITIIGSLAQPNAPAKNAIDGNLNTIWSSGQDPVQWILIDLGTVKTVTGFRLYAAQSPEGETIHQIWVGPDLGNLVLVHEFKGITSDKSELEFTPQTPITNARYIRVLTRQSPSWVAWREIEVTFDQ